MLMTVYRYDRFEGRSYSAYIDSAEIESIREIDARHGRAIIRTKSGDEFVVSDEYTHLVERWKDNGMDFGPKV